MIDDFGRQRCSARDLLNRWIVPLESRVDFLTLNTGQKFELPFLLLVVFATNIRPSELVDEAFLRRIHYKVFAESPTIADFKHIFENCCASVSPLRRRGRRAPASTLLPSAKHRAARLSSARPDRSGARPGVVPRRASTTHQRTAGGRVRQLLRRRYRAGAGLRVIGRGSVGALVIGAARDGCRPVCARGRSVDPHHVTTRPDRSAGHDSHRRPARRRRSPSRCTCSSTSTSCFCRPTPTARRTTRSGPMRTRSRRAS